MPLDYFVYVQIFVLVVIIVCKVIEMFCCGRCDDDLGNSNLNSLYFILCVCFIVATIDGFLHDDLDYSTVSVERVKDTTVWGEPIEESKREKVTIEQPKSPVSLILALCTASGGLYFTCLLAAFIAKRLFGWCRDCCG